MIFDIFAFSADHFIVNAPRCMGCSVNSVIPWHQIAPMVNKSRTADNTSTAETEDLGKSKLKQVCLDFPQLKNSNIFENNFRRKMNKKE